MKDPTGVVLIGVFVAVEGAHAFSAFMPSYFTVSTFVHDDIDRKHLRSGYAPAVAFNLVLGAIVSAIIEDARPLLLSTLVSIAMVALYERAIVETKERQ